MRALGGSDPRRVGAWRIVAGLEGDEMGSVLLAGAPDGRVGAVKVAAARLGADGGFAQRFALEVAGLRRLSGGYTAPVVDAGVADSGPWVALDFLPGVSIREMVERGVLLGEDAVLRLAAALVSSLAEIHGAGLVHRDLTAGNVRLTEDSVRVFDFGVAAALDRDVSLVLGAPEFMSPEQASGQPVTPASDVFSLGVVVHLAATGRTPFAGTTRVETLTQVARAQPELSMALPTRLRQLLAACLVKDPLQRPSLEQLRVLIGPPAPHPWPELVRTMIAEERAELGRLVSLDAPTTRIAPVVVPTAPPPRRRPKPAAKRWRPDSWAVGSAAAVVLTIVFAIIMFNVLTPDRPLRASEQESPAPPTTSEPTTTTTTTTTTTQEPVPGEITGLADKCADVAGASNANGTPVQLHECNGTDAQQWVFSPDGTLQALGKCLDVTGGATEDGTKVQIYDCNGTGAQQWAPTPEGWIVNGETGKCLDIPASATADGTQLIIWTCHGEENQVWSSPGQ